MSDSKRGKGRLVADRRYTKAKAKPKGTAKKPGKSVARTLRDVARPKARTTRRRATTRKPRGIISRMLIAIFLWPFRLFWRLMWRGALVVTLLVGMGVAYYASQLPALDDLLDGRARGSVTLLDKDGQVFAWRGDQFGGVVTAETVSSHLHNAVVATEDKRFYWHPGIDFFGTGAAMVRNTRERGNPFSGAVGSSITQQTAKLLCFGVDYDPDTGQTEAEYEADCRTTTLWRKVKEATYALAMEVKYSKEEILTVYLNRAFLGAGARGFEAASQRYFGKSAANVDPAEAAMLAGLLKAPTRFAPTNDLQRSQDRATVIVGLMEAQGYLTNAQADEARAEPATLSDAAEARAGGYFADWIMESGPEFFTRNTTEDVIIRTTLDPRLQTAAETALRDIFDTKVREGSKAQAAIVVMSADGAVRAMVGGRKIKVRGAFNRATQALRQTGSAFKPFVYATAMELGYGPYDTIVDEPYCQDIVGSGRWCPKNYTNDFRGRVTLTDALKDSLNIPAVRISESLGRDLVIRVAEDFGFGEEIADTPAMALGASESTLIKMTGAYAGILNGGSSVTPYGLVELRLQGDAEPLQTATGGIGERVIQEEAARKLIWMMEKVVSDGTGARARLEGRPAAGKTGTTQAARDAWFIGFTADYVAGVWMGYDDNTPLTGVTGGGLPAEIWHETMERVHAGLPVRDLPMSAPQRAAPAAPAPTPAPAPAPAETSQGESVLQQVLRDLLGGN